MKKVLVHAIAGLLFVCVCAVGFFLYYREREEKLDDSECCANLMGEESPCDEASSEAEDVDDANPEPVQYSVVVVRSMFSLLNNGFQVWAYEYGEPLGSSDMSATLSVAQTDVWFYGRYVYFVANVVPMGCPSLSDTACLEMLGGFVSAFEEYGGIWRVNIDDGQFEHLLVPPREDLYTTSISEVGYEEDNHRLTVTYILSTEGDQFSVVQTIDTETGQQIVE